MNNIDDTLLNSLYGAAQALADSASHKYVTTEHLLSVMLETETMSVLLSSAGVMDLPLLKKSINAATDDQEQCETKARITTTLQNIRQVAIRFVLMQGKLKIEMYHLVLAIMNEKNTHASFTLAKFGVTPLGIKQYITTLDDDDDMRGDGRIMIDGHMIASGPPAKMTVVKAKTTLGKFTTCLNDEASKNRLDPLIGRETEIFELAKITSRRTKNNAVLVGDPGVGKTAIIEGLARLIDLGEVPDAITGSKIYSLDIGAIMAGTKFRGDFEERIKDVIDSLSFLGEHEKAKTILFIDEIHMIMGAGAGSESKGMDLANLLKPHLSKGTLRCIGSTTHDEFRKHFEKDRALLRRFLKINVNEPSVADSIKILNGLAKYYEEHHNLTYADDALIAAVKLSVSHMPNKFLPDKAIDIIDSSGAKQQCIVEDLRKSTIGITEIEEEVATLTGRPITTVTVDEKDRLKNLNTTLSSVVFGQSTAIDKLDDAVIVARAGLRAANKPEGSFLFVGPSGVGKTEIAKQLASALGIHFERIDMSEYMEKHSVSKLIGAPPGYVGFDDNGGKLVNLIDENPHCVLLLDEIEKAHPDVFNILLQVMDNATLTNSSGKTAHFKNVILIMTSNAGARDAQKGSIGFNRVVIDCSKRDAEIKKTFSPEFINRLDAIVPFDALSPTNIKMIVGKFINELNVLTIEKGVTVELDDDAIEWFANEGFDEHMGARPLSRVIDKYIKQPISRDIMFGDLVNGGHVVVSISNDIPTFTITTSLEEADEINI